MFKTGRRGEAEVTAHGKHPSYRRYGGRIERERTAEPERTPHSSEENPQKKRSDWAVRKATAESSATKGGGMQHEHRARQLLYC